LSVQAVILVSMITRCKLELTNSSSLTHCQVQLLFSMAVWARNSSS